jgi:MFS family permease
VPTEAAPESAYAWLRLAISVALSTIGGISLWSVVVVLPAVQTEFGVDRATASLPYTLAMVGFALGGVMMGRMADRWGIMWPTLIGAAALSAGYMAAAASTSLWQFALAHGVLVAFGGAATFGPMVADISHWFTRRRGIAVAIAASGNYLAGTAWPPLVQHYVQSIGLRQTLLGIGILCAVTMIPLALMLRRRPPVHVGTVTTSVSTASLGLSPGALQTTLALAGFCCCVAMSMPQVHIVAYCGDLGYGFTRGTEMLSLMLGLGIVSRVGSGFLASSARSARCWRCCCISVSAPFIRCMRYPRCSGWCRAALYPATPSSSESTCRRAKLACASVSLSWRPCSAWRLAAGSPA